MRNKKVNKIVDLCMCVKELEHVGKTTSKYVDRKYQWDLIELVRKSDYFVIYAAEEDDHSKNNHQILLFNRKKP